MKPKVYLETTIPSYLTSRPSRDLLVAAHQQLTSDWWNDHRDRFSLFISERVLREAASGDASAAARRLAELAGVPQLEFTPEALDGAIDRALARAADERAWHAMMRRAMESDFGWERAAKSYGQVYAQAAARR